MSLPDLHLAKRTFHCSCYHRKGISNTVNLNTCISGKIPLYAFESSIPVFPSCREGGLLIIFFSIIVFFSLAKALLKILHQQRFLLQSQVAEKCRLCHQTLSLLLSYRSLLIHVRTCTADHCHSQEAYYLLTPGVIFQLVK